METENLTQYTRPQLVFSNRLRTVKVRRTLLKTNLEPSPYAIFPISIHVFRIKLPRSLFVIGGALFAFSCLFLGIQFGIISHFGNAVPYWDQWDAEAANLYRPFLEGSLTLKQLIAPHNEHRILTTRLLALLLLKINGLWNPFLQMVVNACLHLLSLFIVLALFIHALGKKIFYPFLFFLLCFFSFPCGWENTLAGFQSQFYFVLIFSLLTLFFLIEKEPLSCGWWVGVGFGVLGFFSFASGVFAFFAGAFVIKIRSLQEKRCGLRHKVALFILGLLSMVALLLTPVVTGHAPLKAHSISQFLKSLIIIMSWPLPGKIGWFLLINFPALLFCKQLFFQPKSSNKQCWILLGLIIWSLLQMMSIAYGRNVGCLASRYMDLFSFSVLINFACFFDQCSKRRKKAMWLALIAWILCVFGGTASWFYKIGLHQLEEKRNYSLVEVSNVNNYQRSGDLHDLQNKNFLEIPYPNAERLALILSYPAIQKILPTCIHKPSSDGTIVEGRYDKAVDFLLSNYFVFIGLGFFFALVTIIFLFKEVKSIGTKLLFGL